MAKKGYSIILACALLMSVLFTCPAAATTEENLLKNGGFEEALGETNIKNWKDSNASKACIVVSSSDQNTVIDNTYTEAYTVSPDGGNYLATPDTATANAYVQQLVNLTADQKGKYYEFSVWYKYTRHSDLAANKFNAKVLVNVKNSSGNLVYDFIDLSPTDGKWTKASHIFYVSDAADRITINLQGGKGAENPTVFWDGAAIVPISKFDSNFFQTVKETAEGSTLINILDDTETIAVGTETAEVPKQVKVYRGYSTKTQTADTGVLGVNYKMSVEGRTEGSRAFKMINTDTIQLTSALFELQASTASHYLLTGYYKVVGSGAAMIGEGNSLLQMNTTANWDAGLLRTTDQWERFEILVEMNTSTSAGDGNHLQLEYRGDGYVLWDDFSLVPYSGLRAIDCEAIKNIDSSGNIGTAAFVWDATVTNPVLVEDSHSGNYGLRVKKYSKATSGDLAVKIGIGGQTAIPMTAGETYKLSYWQKFEQTDATDTITNTVVFDGSFAEGATTQTSTYTFETAASSQEWRYYVRYFTVPEGATAGTVSIGSTGIDTNFRLDDVSLSKVDGIPEGMDGAYTMNSKGIDAINAAGDVILFVNHTGDAATVITAVYQKVGGVKQLANIKFSDVGATAFSDAVWTVPSFNRITVPVEAGETLESFAFTSLSTLEPIGHKLPLS